jgi:hypothetical protein
LSADITMARTCVSSLNLPGTSAAGAVDQAAGEDLFPWAAFALEKAGNFARGMVGVFTVIDRERKEIDAPAGSSAAGRKHDCRRSAHAEPWACLATVVNRQVLPQWNADLMGFLQFKWGGRAGS